MAVQICSGDIYYRPARCAPCRVEIRGNTIQVQVSGTPEIARDAALRLELAPSTDGGLTWPADASATVVANAPT
jgi:hypothetical protein